MPLEAGGLGFRLRVDRKDRELGIVVGHRGVSEQLASDGEVGIHADELFGLFERLLEAATRE